MLPLGAREMFEPEVARLSEARQRLEHPPYVGHLGPEVAAELDQALAALAVVVERAPPLPDFTLMAENQPEQPAEPWASGWLPASRLGLARRLSESPPATVSSTIGVRNRTAAPNGLVLTR